MSQPKPRTWTVEERPVHDEQGQLLGYDLDRQEVIEAYLECETIQRRLGGAIMIVPVRQQQGGDYRTTALRFRWESFVPALREEQTPQPVQESETDLEPALVAVEG